MNTFQKFTRLTNAQRKQIVKAARIINRASAGSFDYDQTIEILTESQYARNEQRRDARNEYQRSRFAVR